LILCEGLAAIGSENHIYIQDIIPNILSLLQSSAICQQGQVKVSYFYNVKVIKLLTGLQYPPQYYQQGLFQVSVMLPHI
jgi:hypothetical protein